MLIRKLTMLIGVLSLAGCITPLPDLTQARSPCRSDPGGWCDFVREAASESYAYAMLSSNAYKDHDTYTKLPLAYIERKAADNDDSGLAYSVFDKYEVISRNRGKNRERGKLIARVIAFRGTEAGSTSDIFSGSLGDSQRTGARAVYVAERSQLDAELLQNVPIEVTGHSLGGALATQISIEHPEVKAYVFNTSPFFSGDSRANDMNRLAVSERGEFLRVLRRYKASPAADVLVINCNPSASAGKKHSIRKLADCLTWIAAYSDGAALDLLEDNSIRKPEVECEENSEHPGLQATSLTPGESKAPCFHSAKPEMENQPEESSK